MTKTWVPFGFTIAEWGAIIRMARRASNLAVDDAKRQSLITDPLSAAVMIFTDDPTAAAVMAIDPDLKVYCGVSQIEGVATVMGENFPPAAFEAERTDKDMPRVAAMFFHAAGTKCPRCRLVGNDGTELCARCTAMMEAA